MPDQFQSPVDAAGPLNVLSTPILSGAREAARIAGADTALANATDVAAPAFKISRRVIRGFFCSNFATVSSPASRRNMSDYLLRETAGSVTALPIGSVSHGMARPVVFAAGTSARRVSLKFPEVAVLGCARQPRAFEGVARQLHQILGTKIGLFLGADEILVHVAAEIGRIVRVHGGADAEIEHPLDLLGLAAVGDKGVRNRTDGERDLPARHLVDQRVGIQDVDAMIDAVDADLLQNLPDVLGRVLLIDVAMHGQEVALAAGSREHVLELHRRIVLLVGIEADADDPFAVRQRLNQRG